MVSEFSRAEVLVGSQGIISLKATTVVVPDVGNVGSHAIEALARCGVGRLALIDSNTVSLTSIGRQSIAMHDTIGRSKTQVVKEKIADLNPDARVITSEQFVLPQNLDTLFKAVKNQIKPSNRVPYILDAIDTVTAKLALVSYVQENGIPIISSMDTGSKPHPELLSISDISQTSVCPLCRVMRKELETRNISHLKICRSPEPPLTPGPIEEDTGNRRATPDNISFIPPVAGPLIAGQIVRDICGLD